MESWPDIMLPTSDLDEKDYFPQSRTSMEDGTVAVGDMVTRVRGIFPLEWDTMPEADYQTLNAFWRANRSLHFLWTHPITAAVYECLFTSDQLNGRLLVDYPGYRRVSCPIEEV